MAGESLFIERFTDLVRTQCASNPEQLAAFERLQARSMIVAPLIARGATVALISFFTTGESGRSYGPQDVLLAEELVRRAGAIAENARLHEALRISDRRVRAAIHNSGTYLIEKHDGGQEPWVYNSPFAPETTLLAPDEKVKVRRAEDRVRATGEHARVEFRATVAGGVRDYLIDMEPLRDGRGAIVGVAGTGTDVTELKKVQSELAEALAFRDRVMGVLSHDLRNPVGAIDALATLSLRSDLTPVLRRRLEKMGEAAKRSLTMIETLLDFSESRFKRSLDLSTVASDLAQIASRVVEELAAAHAGREIAYEIRGTGTIEVDPMRFAQVASNLIANALIHGAPERPVRVALSVSKDGATFTVRNQGPVIPREQFDSLFEPFKPHTARPGARRGLGLGLYIVRSIVAAHGGSVTVESNETDGTTFTVRLPSRQAR